MVGPDLGEDRPVPRAEPRPIGLARSLSARFEALGLRAPGDEDEAEVGGGVPSSRDAEAPGDAAARAPRTRSDEVHARERFTNRLARYLQGSSATKSELLPPLLEDIEELRGSGAVGPLAEAAIAVYRTRDSDGDPTGVDPLLGQLLGPAVRGVLGERLERAGEGERGRLEALLKSGRTGAAPAAPAGRREPVGPSAARDREDAAENSGEAGSLA